MNGNVDRDHFQLGTFAGPYALDRLGVEDRARFERHLEQCEICRREVAEMLPAVTALRGIPIPRHSAPLTPPADLGDRVVAAVAGERRTEDRRRWLRQAGVAAVAAAVAAVVLVTGLVLTRDDPPPTAEQRATERVVVVIEEAEIDATANLVNHSWGVEIRMEATGFEEGARYQAFVIADDGEAFPAGEFVGVGDRVMRCNLNSALLRPDADGFEIRDVDGEVVVSSEFGPPPTAT